MAISRRHAMETTGTIDWGRFDALTFDCYGTLIDWERGILDALQPLLAPAGVETGEDDLLEAYARYEAALEAGAYRPYREVVGLSLRGLCDDLGVTPSEADVARFSASVADWPAFPDSAAALRRLATRFRLGVITNCDEDLFAASSRRLGVPFDWVVTAERARSYKPSERTFLLALEVVGLPRERILHVAQSLYHDHVPAQALGLATVWIDRRQGRRGSGATPPASARPDLTLPDLRRLAELALAQGV